MSRLSYIYYIMIINVIGLIGAANCLRASTYIMLLSQNLQTRKEHFRKCRRNIIPGTFYFSHKYTVLPK